MSCHQNQLQDPTLEADASEIGCSPTMYPMMEEMKYGTLEPGLEAASGLYTCAVNMRKLHQQANYISKAMSTGEQPLDCKALKKNLDSQQSILKSAGEHMRKLGHIARKKRVELQAKILLSLETLPDKDLDPIYQHVNNISIPEASRKSLKKISRPASGSTEDLRSTSTIPPSPVTPTKSLCATTPGAPQAPAKLARSTRMPLNMDSKSIRALFRDAPSGSMASDLDIMD